MITRSTTNHTNHHSISAVQSQFMKRQARAVALQQASVNEPGSKLSFAVIGLVTVILLQMISQGLIH